MDVFLHDICERFFYLTVFSFSHKKEMRSGTHLPQPDVFLPGVHQKIPTPNLYLTLFTSILLDCDVVGRWHQAEWSKLSAWCQNGRCYLPLKMPKIHRFSPPKIEAATPSPSHSSPNPAALHLIVMFSVPETGRSNRIQPPGCKMNAILSPSPPTKILDLPS